MMYQAMVIACAIGTSNMSNEFCVHLEAQKWQDSEAACQGHALILAERVYRYMPGYKAVGWTCKALPRGVLSQ